MHNKLVSVIMGAYNCENTIERSIKSIIDQTYDNWELIICDDCSMDNTYGVLSKYKNNPKIKILRNDKNRKLAYSLNQCLRVAKGEYIARMDADDESLPKRFEVEVDFLEKHPEFELVSCRSVVSSQGKNLGIRGIENEPTSKDLITGNPFMHPTIMMRKRAYDRLNGYTVSKRTERGQDVDLWFRFFKEGYRGYVINDVLYKYSESISDFKRRTLKSAIGCIQTSLYGYKLLDIPMRYYICAFKPLLRVIFPNKLLYFIKGKQNVKQ